MDKKNKIIIISLLSALLIVLCVFAVEMKNTEKKAYQGISEIGEDQNTEVENKDNSQFIDMSLAKDIEAYFQENGIDHEKVAYCITDLEHNIKYSMNEKDEFIAASIYKLPLAMLYYDKVANEEIKNSHSIMETLVKNHSLILIDCDFNTPIEYFAKVQELYLVQSMDVLTIQPLTEFLRELKIKNALEESKIRIISIMIL